VGYQQKQKCLTLNRGQLKLQIIKLDEYRSFIALSRYSRWQDKKQRRETWTETVERLRDFWVDRFPKQLKGFEFIWDHVNEHETLPSMRTLATAGKALDRDNIAGYNCSYVAVDHPRVFDETMYILMNGTGLGFSVERQYINKLPEIQEEIFDTDTTILVRDSKTGWAKAYKELIGMLYNGQAPKWDVSKVRKAGERLKTFGGRASGPEPLVNLFKFTVEVFRNAKGRKLTSIECHDLMCKIAEIVVVGGVRRSALISLSNLSDERMRNAKMGQWWDYNGQRQLANNSVCYTELPEINIFMKEWLALMESGSGERGIFNREAAERLVPQRRKDLMEYLHYGCNPCSEIILRMFQFCNLSEVVVRPHDTYETILKKVEVAAILGTLQATLTDFKYIRSVWKKNTEEEALLGVSLTGIMDHPVFANKKKPTEANGFPNFNSLEMLLETLRNYAVTVNVEWAEKLGINPAMAVTCTKPSGTASQLVDSASGAHTRYSKWYIRTVRADKKDPLAKMMVDLGFPVEDNKMNESQYVFSFPIESPKKSVFRDDLTAIEQLEFWKLYQLHWCEHKPSITIYVKQHEWLAVGAWVYENFDIISGVSFLPHSEHTYQQAPYQECSKEDYLAFVETMPKDVDWSELSKYEMEDNTESSHTLACTGNSCELA